MAMERDALLKQADHMWKMLDNMAEQDPKGYQQFIKKQLQDGAASLKPPQPVFCLSCDINEASSNCNLLYINVCQWTKVPAPKTDNDAIPVKGGTLRKLDKTAQVYDVAFNPSVIEDCARQDVKGQLIELILNHTTDMTKLKLKRNSCKKISKKFVGSEKEVISSIDEHQQSHDATPKVTTDQPQSLLEQLANINREAEEDSDIVLSKEPDVKTPHKKLIEEISSENKETLPYQVINKDGKVFVTIDVGSDSKQVGEAELDVSEHELEFKLPDMSDRLVVKLPHAVDKDTTIAKFQPKTGRLCITMICK